MKKPQHSITDVKKEYHRQVDDHISRINEGLKTVFDNAQVQDKGDSETVSNLQLKASNLIIMQSMNELLLLLQRFKHHSTPGLRTHRRDAVRRGHD